MSVTTDFDDEEALARTDVGSQIGDPKTVRADGRDFSGSVSGFEETVEAALNELIGRNEN